MVKKMIYLDPQRHALLKKIAAAEKASETEVVRRALDLYAVSRDGEDPLVALIAKYSGPETDGSDRHDEHILEGPRVP
jgi:hypothetical protein